MNWSKSLFWFAEGWITRVFAKDSLSHDKWYWRSISTVETVSLAREVERCSMNRCNVLDIWKRLCCRLSFDNSKGKFAVKFDGWISPKMAPLVLFSTGFELVFFLLICCQVCCHLLGSHSHEDYADFGDDFVGYCFELSKSLVGDQH